MSDHHTGPPPKPGQDPVGTDADMPLGTYALNLLRTTTTDLALTTEQRDQARAELVAELAQAERERYEAQAEIQQAVALERRQHDLTLQALAQAQAELAQLRGQNARLQHALDTAMAEVIAALGPETPDASGDTA